MPCDYRKYPSCWRTETVPRILNRANFRCEQCGIYHHAVGFRDESGKFYGNGGNRDCDASGIGQAPDGTMLTYSEAKAFVDHYNNSGSGKRKTDESGNRWFVVVLTIAHLKRTGDPENDGPIDCPDSDLAALCQSCHLRADKDRHKIKRMRGRKERMAAGSLFELANNVPAAS